MPRKIYTDNIINKIELLAKLDMTKSKILAALPSLVEPSEKEVCSKITEKKLIDLAQRKSIKIKREQPPLAIKDNIPLIKEVQKLRKNKVTVIEIAKISNLTPNSIYGLLKIDTTIKKEKKTKKPKKLVSINNITENEIRYICLLLGRKEVSLTSVEKIYKVLLSNNKTPLEKIDTIIKKILLMQYVIEDSVKQQIIKLYLS